MTLRVEASLLRKKEEMKMETWKKWTAVTMLTFCLAVPGFVNAEEKMVPNFNYTGVETVMQDGMEQVPLRQVAETLGYKVIWNDLDRSITLAMAPKMDNKMMDDKKMEDKMMDMGYSVMLKIDSKTIMVGKMEKMLSYSPMIINDKTYVTKDFVDMYLVDSMMMK
jgi:hypothetical protein